MHIQILHMAKPLSQNNEKGVSNFGDIKKKKGGFVNLLKIIAFELKF